MFFSAIFPVGFNPRSTVEQFAENTAQHYAKHADSLGLDFEGYSIDFGKCFSSSRGGRRFIIAEIDSEQVLIAFVTWRSVGNGTNAITCSVFASEDTTRGFQSFTKAELIAIESQNLDLSSHTVNRIYYATVTQEVTFRFEIEAPNLRQAKLEASKLDVSDMFPETRKTINVKVSK